MGQRARRLFSPYGAKKSECSTSERSWFRVLSGVGIAAWLLNRLELHKLDASKIGIVDVERPFAVAADFGGARLLELPHCRNISAETPGTCCGTAYALARMGIDASTIVHDILRAGECHRKVAHFPIPTGNLSPMAMGTIQGGHTAHSPRSSGISLRVSGQRCA